MPHPTTASELPEWNHDRFVLVCGVDVLPALAASKRHLHADPQMTLEAHNNSEVLDTEAHSNEGEDRSRDLAVLVLNLASRTHRQTERVQQLQQEPPPEGQT